MPAIAWHDGALYVVMNNRDQLDVLWPGKFTAEENANRPAEPMYRIDKPGDNFGWPYCSCSVGFEDEWDYNYGTLDGIGTANPGTGEKYRCLTATGSTSGSTLVLDACGATLRRTQLWTIENGALLGLPATTLIVGVNGLWVDRQGGPPVSGDTQLIIGTCTGATSQNRIVR